MYYLFDIRKSTNVVLILITSHLCRNIQVGNQSLKTKCIIQSLSAAMWSVSFISTHHRQISIGNLPCICMKVREGLKDHIVMVSLIVRVDPLVLTVAHLFQGPRLCSSSASSIRHSKRQTGSWGRAGSCTRVPGPREKENSPHGHLTPLSQNQHLHQHHLVRPLAMQQGR